MKDMASYCHCEGHSFFIHNFVVCFPLISSLSHHRTSKQNRIQCSLTQDYQRIYTDYRKVCFFFAQMSCMSNENWGRKGSGLNGQQLTVSWFVLLVEFFLPLHVLTILKSLKDGKNNKKTKFQMSINFQNLTINQ